MEIFGEIKGRTRHREVIKSPVVSTLDKVSIELIYNDVPVYVFYKAGNTSWKSLLINNVYNDAAIPKYSDIYLSCTLNNEECIRYSIKY